MKVLNILDSGNVVRFHAVPGVGKQKNSEHQWGVALLVAAIKPDCSKELLLAALTHDSAEIVTGDIPFTFKKIRPNCFLACHGCNLPSIIAVLTLCIALLLKPATAASTIKASYFIPLKVITVYLSIIWRIF